MMPKTETSEDDTAEVWSTPVNWEEDLSIEAEWRRKGRMVVLLAGRNYVKRAPGTLIYLKMVL